MLRGSPPSQEMGSPPSPGTLHAFVPGVWTAADPVRIVGMRLTATMAVVEIPGGGLVLHSPVRMTPERRAAIDALGAVTHLYAPNALHHLWIGPWAEAYPSAVVHAPRSLRSKRPDLRIDRHHNDEPPGDLAQAFDEVHVGGCILEESVLVHRTSGTLLVADLVHNVGRPSALWTKTYSSMMGFYGRVAISRALRWLTFRDRKLARASIDRIGELTFDRLVFGHGEPLHAGARAALLEAYEWLRPKGGLVARALPAPRRGFCG